MKLKTAILACVVWTLLVGGGFMIYLWYLVENRIGGPMTERRQQQLGTTAGLVALAGIYAIVMYWLFKRKRGQS